MVFVQWLRLYLVGVVPNTVWLGHAGLKKSGAGIGFSWMGGVFLGLAGLFGLFTFFSELVPPAICAINIYGVR